MKSILRFVAELRWWAFIIMFIALAFYCDMWLTGRLPSDEQLLYAIDQREPSQVTAELCAGASIDARDVTGATALMHAASFGELEQVRQLLDLHADVNAVDRDGNNALMRAAAANQPAIVRLLLARGIDPNHRNRLNVTARDIAEMYQAREVIAVFGSAEFSS